MRTLVAAAVLALAGTACARARGPSADRAEGGAPATTAFDAARAATDKGEAVRALTRRHRDQVVAFGPHKFHGTAQAVLRDGDRELAALEEDASIEAAGAVHARYANSKHVRRGRPARRGRADRRRRRPGPGRRARGAAGPPRRQGGQRPRGRRRGGAR